MLYWFISWIHHDSSGFGWIYVVMHSSNSIRGGWMREECKHCRISHIMEWRKSCKKWQTCVICVHLDCIRLTRLRLAVHRKVAPRTLCGQSQQILNDSWILHLSPRVWGFCTSVPRPRWVVLKPLAGVNPCPLHWSNDCKGCKNCRKEYIIYAKHRPEQEREIEMQSQQIARKRKRTRNANYCLDRSASLIVTKDDLN